MKSESVGNSQSKPEMRKASDGPRRADGDHVAHFDRAMSKSKQRSRDREDEKAMLEEEIADESAVRPTGMSSLFNQAAKGLPGAGEKTLGEMLVGDGHASGEGEADPNLGGLLAGQGGVSPAPGRADVTATAGVERPAAPQQLEQLVERILVSAPGADGSSEARIRLDPKLLPDTEVRMAFRPGEGLSVEFMTDKVDSQRFLLPNLASLRERLTDKTGEAVVVRMSENASADTGDGRSRNRRNLYEEMGNDRPV